MRIAVSGTHCSGKSTLIDAFLSSHPHYEHEPEAYEALQDLHGQEFSAEPSAEEFMVQLNYQISRLQQYRQGHHVIFERSPVDYLAYQQALIDLDRDGASKQLLQESIELVRSSLRLLDLIVLLSPTASVPEEEDLKLRLAVHNRLEEFLLDDVHDLLGPGGPIVIEARGSTEERLKIIEASLK